MINHFDVFSKAVNKRLNAITKGGSEVYRVECPDVFDKYLSFFPEGSNPIFRERTEHDCNCCKQFIRNLGLAVTIDGGELQTVWGELGGLPHPYGKVAQSMDELVKGCRIRSVYRTVETRFGIESNVDKDGIRWNHFFGNTPQQALSNSPGTAISQIDSCYTVLSRGLEQINVGDIDEVLDLIRSNSIYRGEEHKDQISQFRKLLVGYEKAANKELFVWENVNNRAARFRNTVIGTLLIDLAEGKGIEEAVKSFESKVAPANYKRPTALITESMVKAAVKTLKDLDLEDSLNRRFARISDISVNDIILIDNEVISKTKDGITELLMDSVKTRKSKAPKEEISIEEFLALKPNKIEVVLDKEHIGNFVSLTAPVHPDSPSLFKWDNAFGWSYDGNVTDSIKERVKAAGGNVDAKLRCSLAWFNGDDLDIHCYTPTNNHIYFGNKAGVLDVDMNAGGPSNSKDPVENLSFTSLTGGIYRIEVNNYRKRSETRPGFKLQVEFEGQVYDFGYSCGLRTGETVNCLEIEIREGKLVSIRTLSPSLKGEAEISIEKWGIKTLKPQRVNMVMLSPNHWENSNKTGNKHYFFILDGCLNPEPTRGIYNEFLNPELEKHRKVFEVLGSKTLCQPSNDQLSGVGFSTTKPTRVKMVADGRPYTVKF